MLWWYRTALLTLLAAVAWQLWVAAPSPIDDRAAPDRDRASGSSPAPPDVASLPPLPPQSAPTPQNPSPMSDTTRPHPRFERRESPGRRFPLSIGTLYLAPGFALQPRVAVLVHFHGAGWVLERHLTDAAPDMALVTVQLGAGSRVYANAFAEPARLTSLLIEAAARLSRVAGYTVGWRSITLSAFSAGYGAVRSVLQQRAQVEQIDGVLLADSLHASYVNDASSGGASTAPWQQARTTDPAVDASSLEPFVDFARLAVSGAKWMWVTHSEVYPGTYASTTEAADALLTRIAVARRPVLRAGPIGMQQLSEAARGGFYLAGYAGNSAPDHMDHLYALGDWLRRARAREPAPAPSAL